MRKRSKYISTLQIYEDFKQQFISQLFDIHLVYFQFSQDSNYFRLNKEKCSIR
jgi:hypothetical protein